MEHGIFGVLRGKSITAVRVRGGGGIQGNSFRETDQPLNKVGDMKPARDSLQPLGCVVYFLDLCRQKNIGK